MRTVHSRYAKDTCTLVLLATLSCSSSGTSSDGGTSPEDSPSESGPATITEAGAMGRVGEDATSVSSDAGACVPCQPDAGVSGDEFKCTQLQDPSPGAIQGAVVYLEAMAASDGTCMIASVTLQCGGGGTFADGSPLLWSLANGVVTFRDSTRAFSCIVQ